MVSKSDVSGLYTEQNFRYFSACFIVDIYRNEIFTLQLSERSLLCDFFCLSGFCINQVLVLRFTGCLERMLAAPLQIIRCQAAISARDLDCIA